MPFVISALVMPLIALYVKFKIFNFAFKIVLLSVIYLAYTNFSQWFVDTLMSHLTTASMPCLVLFTINELDLFSLLNLVLSYLSTLAVAKYMFSKLGHLL